MAEYLAENSQLRQLSRRYAEGQLALAEYRAERREILEALAAGRVQTYVEPVAPADPAPSFEATDLRLPDDSAVFYKTMPPRAQAQADAPPLAAAASGWDGPARMLAAVLGLSLLIAVAALVYVFAL